MAVAAGQNLGTVRLAGEHRFQVLTGDFNPPHRLKTFGAALEESWNGPREEARDFFSVTRVIYVADSDREAIEDMRESYNQTITWEIANTPWHQAERVPPGGTLDDITYDYLVESRNLFIGSPDTVYDCIKELYEHVGGFGLLMFHAGRDYATREKRERSMRLFMREVAPRLRELDAARRQRVAVAA
jgi:alkanesulfonate monooxygenase SsuD/methylene tetrahydromethanopterin reductase-like flavin-dependent oxidoreductase (luciferase family)